MFEFDVKKIDGGRGGGEGGGPALFFLLNFFPSHFGPKFDISNPIGDTTLHYTTTLRYATHP